MPRTIEQQIKATYFALRVGAAAIAFIFPLLLWVGGRIAGFTLRDSMSAYYWTTRDQLCPCGENSDHSCTKKGSEVDLALTPSPREKALEPGTMRNWFVGLLFAIGTILYVNQGHSRKEDFALTLAGLLAVGIALPDALGLLTSFLFASRALRGIVFPVYRICLCFLFTRYTCADQRPEGTRALSENVLRARDYYGSVADRGLCFQLHHIATQLGLLGRAIRNLRICGILVRQDEGDVWT